MQRIAARAKQRRRGHHVAGMDKNIDITGGTRGEIAIDGGPEDESFEGEQRNAGLVEGLEDGEELGSIEQVLHGVALKGGTELVVKASGTAVVSPRRSASIGRTRCSWAS